MLQTPSPLGAILVTGATGFIGGRLRAEGRALVRCARRDTDVVGDLLDFQSLQIACKGFDTIYHCAGYAHDFGGADPDIYRRVNFEGTRNLLNAAGLAGVQRFVFLSSVKAATGPTGDCLDETAGGTPTTPYGQSKREAELAVLEAGDRYGMHVVNLRLAMVYGRGGRGNLERMAKAIRAGWFPPLPDTQNRRSVVHVSDVTAAIQLVASDPRAAGQTFIVADQNLYSGKQIYDAIREALGLSKVSWALPEPLYRTIGKFGDCAERLLKRYSPVNSALIERLLGSECYSAALIDRVLGWRAKMALPGGIREMIDP
jgi:UDP-glucose 4-epimerase